MARLAGHPVAGSATHLCSPRDGWVVEPVRDIGVVLQFEDLNGLVRPPRNNASPNQGMEGAHVQRQAFDGNPGLPQHGPEARDQAGEIELVTFISDEPADDPGGPIRAAPA